MYISSKQAAVGLFDTCFTRDMKHDTCSRMNGALPSGITISLWKPLSDKCSVSPFRV